MEEGGPCALTLRLSHVFLAYVSLKNVKTPLLQTPGGFPQIEESPIFQEKFLRDNSVLNKKSPTIRSKIYDVFWVLDRRRFSFRSR